MTNQPYTPGIRKIREEYAQAFGIRFLEGTAGALEHFDQTLAIEIAAAEQRGAERAFRKTQEIIAGFEHTIDEARERDDMINAGYLIQEIDTEIQDLMEGNDD